MEGSLSANKVALAGKLIRRAKLPNSLSTSVGTNCLPPNKADPDSRDGIGSSRTPTIRSPQSIKESHSGRPVRLCPAPDIAGGRIIFPYAGQLRLAQQFFSDLTGRARRRIWS